MPDIDFVVHSAKIFGAWFSGFPETEVIQVELRLIQREGPKARLYNLWPSMLRMDQHCHWFLCEFFNSSLGYYFLKVCSDSVIADCLVIIWQIALKTFLCKNSMVYLKFLHSDAKGCCHWLICCFGLNVFDEGLASLKMGVHVRGGMVYKNCRRPEMIGG